MKRKIALLLTTILCVSLVACNTETTDANVESTLEGSEILAEASELETDVITSEVEETSTNEEETLVGSTYTSNGDGTHSVYTIYENGDIEEHYALACEYENNICSLCGYELVEEVEEDTSEVSETPSTNESTSTSETEVASEEPSTPPSEEPAPQPVAPAPEVPAPTPNNGNDFSIEVPAASGWIKIAERWECGSENHSHIIVYEEQSTWEQKEEVTTEAHTWVTGPIIPRTAPDGSVTYAGTYICSVCGYDSCIADPSTVSTTAP